MPLPDDIELSRQLRRPNGDYAKEVGVFMEKINKDFYSFVLSGVKVPEDAHILEIGPGNGNFVPLFSALGPDVQYSGCEMSEEMLESCLEKNAALVENGRAWFFLSDCIKLPLPDKSVDLLVAINVVYFWEPLEEYLFEFQRVLKPGGQLLLGFRDKATMQQLPFTKQGFVLYHPEELSRSLESCGFSDLKIRSETEKIKTLQGEETELRMVSLLASNGNFS